MSHKDPMGDRLKLLEKFGTEHRAMPQLPLCVRLDGRAFHTYTKNMNHPFDDVMSSAMDTATIRLVSEFKPVIGYTQSDEITLVFYNEPDPAKNPSEFLFGGKFHKINSVLASTAAVEFYRAIIAQMPEMAGTIPSFDCRTWSVPSKTEAVNTLLWRWFDAKKNSVSTLAQHHFSHKKLHKMGISDMHDLLLSIGVDWNALPTRHKWGAFFRRESVMRSLSEEELSRIPEKHRPSGPVMRTMLKRVEIGRFDKAEDRMSLIFGDTFKDSLEHVDG